MKLRTKRIYEDPAKSDGRRILVDRLWPRGVSKEKAKIEYWAKEISPSNELRRWYQHDPDKWPEFRRRYFKELSQNPDGVTELMTGMNSTMGISVSVVAPPVTFTPVCIP